MELRASLRKMGVFAAKYKHILLIIALGVVFMMVPAKNNTQKNTVQQITAAEKQSEDTVELKLSNILKQIHGAGKVEVMLTVAKGESVVFQTNQDVTTDSESSRINTTTVTVTDAERNQTALVQQRSAPIYQGAIVVCQGGDDPVVRLSIIEAVSKITGLKSSSISVLKMK